MGTLKTRLRKMMNEKGIKQIELARQTGIERSLISSYLSGRYEPKEDKLQALADALDCDALWLSGNDEINEDDESRCLLLFRSLNVPDKRTALSFLEVWSSKQKPE